MQSDDSTIACVPIVTTLGQPDGSIYGERQAVLTTKDREIMTSKGMELGKPNGKGLAIRWRDTKTYQTSSQRLARLSIPLVFKAEADENDDGWHKHWEWE